MNRETVWSILAMFIDTDGGINHYPEKNRTEVAFYNTELGLMNRVEQLLPGLSVIIKFPQTKTNGYKGNKPIFHARINQALHTLYVLKNIQPYLSHGEKQTKCQDAIQYLEHKTNHPNYEYKKHQLIQHLHAHGLDPETIQQELPFQLHPENVQQTIKQTPTNHQHKLLEKQINKQRNRPNHPLTETELSQIYQHLPNELQNQLNLIHQ